MSSTPAAAGIPSLLAALVDASDEELPETLRDAVTTRVDSLGEDVGATLRVAAVLGPACDLELVAQVAGTPIATVLVHLERAAQVGLIVERGSRFEFRHQLIREALEAATGAARRALLHQQAARALAGRPRPDPLAVALHARAGGDVALASTSFAAAAAAAAARFDLELAEDHLAAALTLAPTPEAYIARARVRIARRAYDEAAADARQAIALGGAAPALEVAGWAAYYRRGYEQARAYADEAAARAFLGFGVGALVDGSEEQDVGYGGLTLAAPLTVVTILLSRRAGAKASLWARICHEAIRRTEKTSESKRGSTLIA